MAETKRHIVRSSIIEETFQRLLREKRVIFITGPISLAVSSALTLMILASEFEKDKSKPVWVVISSNGGGLYSGLAVYDLLRSLVEKGVPVHTIGVGLVASIAVPIFQAGTRRSCFPNTHIVIHQASLHGLGGGEVNMLDDEIKNSLKLNSRVLDVICLRSGVARDQLIQDTRKTDLLLNAEEALRYGPHGLVDEIITTWPF